MHCPVMLDGNIEASSFGGRGDHPVPVGCESELRILTSLLAVLVEGQPGVSQRSSIGDDDFGRPRGKLLTIQHAAIRVIESSSIDARAARTLPGKRNPNSTSHPLWRQACSNFRVCRASLSAGHVHADLEGAGLDLFVSLQRLKSKSAMRIR